MSLTAKGSEILDIRFDPGVSVGFDAQAFDDAILAHGARFEHFRCLPNPVGMIDQYDSTRPDADHSHSSNGMLYHRAGIVAGNFTGNTKELRQISGGYLSAATAQLTVATKYCGGECECDDVYLHPGDRLYLTDETVMVPFHQFVEAHQTGKDRLKFLALKVTDLVDSKGVLHKPGDDFQIRNGVIHWLPGKALGSDPNTGKGMVYSIRYMYRPHWYVERLLHELRMIQVEDPLTGDRKYVRAPQAAAIQREYVYRGSESADPEASPSPRQGQQPASGGLGPQ